jgi:hypothetical protein
MKPFSEFLSEKLNAAYMNARLQYADEIMRPCLEEVTLDHDFKLIRIYNEVDDGDISTATLIYGNDGITLEIHAYCTARTFDELNMYESQYLWAKLIWEDNIYLNIDEFYDAIRPVCQKSSSDITNIEDMLGSMDLCYRIAKETEEE